MFSTMFWMRGIQKDGKDYKWYRYIIIDIIIILTIMQTIILQDYAAESQQLLLSAELYGQYVSLALRSEAVDTGNVTEIKLVRQNIGMHILHHLLDS